MSAAAPSAPALARRRPGRPPTTGAYSKGYKPGQFDRLLPIKEHVAPDQLKAVSFEVSATGLSIIATEHCKDGRSPKRIVNAFPYYIDIELPDGRSCSIEVRMYDAPADQPPERTYVRRRADPLPASLTDFGSDDSAYHQEGD